MEKKSWQEVFSFKKSSKDYVKTLIICAILTALGFVLDRFLGLTFPLFGVKSLSLNFSFIPIIFAGFVYGPLWGALVGVAQDLISCLLVPLGAFIPGITLTTALVGLFAGLYAILFRKSYNKLWALVCFSIFITIFSSITNSYWLSLTYSKISFWAYVPPRLLASLLISMPLNALILYILMNRAVPILKKSKLI